MKNINKVKKKLKEKKNVLGAFVMFPSTDIVEMLGYSNFDFVVIDSEHGRMGIETIENHVRAADSVDVVPIVRVPNDKNKILQVIETGCLGIQVPQINNAQEVQEIMDTVKYFPEGKRGMALTTRAGNYGTNSLKEHMERTNKELLISIQVENLEAVNNLSEILEVPGIDVLFVGPADLSQSLGLPGQSNHPKVKETIDKIYELAEKADLAVGFDTGSVEDARKWLEYGMRFVTVGPGLLFKGCKEVATQIRQKKCL